MGEDLADDLAAVEFRSCVYVGHHHQSEGAINLTVSF